MVTDRDSEIINPYNQSNYSKILESFTYLHMNIEYDIRLLGHVSGIPGHYCILVEISFEEQGKQQYTLFICKLLDGISRS